MNKGRRRRVGEAKSSRMPRQAMGNLEGGARH